MIIKNINLNSIDEKIVASAAKIIKGGGVVVFPTDTCYGLATNPNKSDAVERLYKIKGRLAEKSISCIFQDLNQISSWANLEHFQKERLKKNLPGPFTFIIKANQNYPLKGETIGIRLPDDKLTKALSQELDFPYTATSANISGQEPAYNLDEILNQFEGQIYQPDLVINAGPLLKGLLSTVVDITGYKPKIIRQGSGKLR